MTELNTTQRRRPARILAAILAVYMGATAIPATAFASSGDRDQERAYLQSRHEVQRTGVQRQHVQRQYVGDRSKHRKRDYRQARRHDNRGYRDNRHAHRRHRHDDDDVGAAVAGAFIGFALGAIIADGYNESRYAPPSRTYYGPSDDDYVPPRQGYYGPAEARYAPAPEPVYAPAPEYKPEPFTDDWYAYCASKYQTFDPQTGTFQPYEGPRKLCN